MSSSLLPLIPQPNFCYYIISLSHIHISNIFYTNSLICNIFTDFSEKCVYIYIKCLKNRGTVFVILNVKQWEAASNFDCCDKFLSLYSSSDCFKFLPNFNEKIWCKCWHKNVPHQPVIHLSSS